MEEEVDRLGRVGGADRGCDLFGCAGPGRKGCEHLRLQGQDGRGRLLAGLDAGLVVGVDADQAGVEADGSLEERDEPAHSPGLDARDGDGHGLAVVLEQRGTSAEVEAVQVVARGDARLDLVLRAAGLEDADEVHEEVIDAVAKLLPQVFAWARSVDPQQPLTSGVWKGDWSSEASMSEVARIQVRESDVISFHNYGWPEDFEQRVLVR